MHYTCPGYLSNPLLHRGLGDEAVDHHLLVLTDTMSSAEGLDAEEEYYEKLK